MSLARLLTIPGIAAVNSWGGPTKEFQVEVDPHKLEAYSVTVPQILTALGNANINVGGREIRIGQQSVNIRGVGLIDDGGNDDLAQGYKVGDIENVVLTQDQWRPRADQGCWQGLSRLPAEARHSRPRPSGRCYWRNRGAEANRKNRRHDSKGRSGHRKVESRREPAPGSQGCSVLRPLFADRPHDPHRSAQLDIRVPTGLFDSVDFSRESSQRGHRWIEHSIRAFFRDHSCW